MIPNMAGAAFAGLLVLLISGALAAGLLGWWGWRRVAAARGMPRPPLRLGHAVLAVVASILPISTGVSLLSLWFSDHLRAQQERAEDVWRYQTLKQDQAWGEVVLPAGSHIERELPPPWLVVDTSIPPELPDGTLDLRYLVQARLAAPVQLGPVWVQAFSMSSFVVELARDHPAAGADCLAGRHLQFEAAHVSALDTRPTLQQVQQWRWDTCFWGDPIQVRFWDGDTLRWTQPAAAQDATTERTP